MVKTTLSALEVFMELKVDSKLVGLFRLVYLIPKVHIMSNFSYPCICLRPYIQCAPDFQVDVMKFDKIHLNQARYCR
jgi:hypothetical protein